jgi:predicted RNase H-like HicB family nuclease
MASIITTKERAMLNKNLTIRSYITKQDGLWVGVCIDLSLATQADSLEECRHQLEEQIESYLFDAIEGEDKEFSEQLLNRRAPLSQVLCYHMFSLLALLHLTRCRLFGFVDLFVKKMPLSHSHI